MEGFLYNNQELCWLTGHRYGSRNKLRPGSRWTHRCKFPLQLTLVEQPHRHWRLQTMKQKPRSRVNRKKAKTILRLPDLEHAKAAVLNSLTSADAQRGYHHAIDEFIEWYCSEPRLAFNRIVVLRYRSYLESG